VISCHYNFAGYKSPERNLWRFLAHMEESEVPVYGVEAHLPGKSVTGHLPHWRQIEVGHNAMLWQKEALLNVAETLVPARYNQLAWIDADITFSTLRWPEMLARALQTCKVVQMFHRCQWLRQNGSVDLERESCIKQGLNRRWLGHPGFAWGARRELWTRAGGIYDFAIAGSGDVCFAAAVLAQEPVQRMISIRQHDGCGIDNPVSRERYAAWAKPVGAWVGGAVGYLPCDVKHHWHGSRKDRQYNARNGWVLGLDVTREIVRADAGHLEWTPAADAQRRAMISGYFKARKEDAA
jgi:hypothetical protein